MFISYTLRVVSTTNTRSNQHSVRPQAPIQKTCPLSGAPSDVILGGLHLLFFLMVSKKNMKLNPCIYTVVNF